MHPLIPFHIAAGAIALASGFAALALRKGSPLHARAGSAFAVSMLAMAGSGTVVALAMPERGTAMVGVFSCYLVATSWAAARNRSGGAGLAELAGFLVALGCAAAFLAIAAAGYAQPDGKLDRLPASFHLPFAALAVLAAALDLRVFLRRRLSPSQRIARHLWRMSAALLIASMSFFLGQQDALPRLVAELRLNLVPLLVVLAVMLWWIARIRLRGAPRRRASTQEVPPLAAEHS